MNGLIENVKMPINVNYDDWSTSYKNPHGSDGRDLVTWDGGKMGRPHQLHVATYAIIKFVKQHKRYPTKKDVPVCLEMAKEELASS